jgi:hypothetical protein
MRHFFQKAGPYARLQVFNSFSLFKGEFCFGTAQNAIRVFRNLLESNNTLQYEWYCSVSGGRNPPPPLPRIVIKYPKKGTLSK